MLQLLESPSKTKSASESESASKQKAVGEPESVSRLRTRVDAADGKRRLLVERFSTFLKVQGALQ